MNKRAAAIIKLHLLIFCQSSVNIINTSIVGEVSTVEVGVIVMLEDIIGILTI